MILSMTGFGQATRVVGNNSYRIEIKSLNGKTTDIRFKSTSNLRNRELELRKMILDKSLRGKFEVNLTVESQSGGDNMINKQLMNSYYKELKSFSEENGISGGDIIQSIIRLPNVVQVMETEITDEEWLLIQEMVNEAIEQLYQFRKEEGDSLKKDIILRTSNIEKLLVEIDKYASNRIVNFRERIRKNLNQYMAKENVDENRFEQEIIFYLEKLDINEEKVRLSQHCKFFKEEVASSEIPKGKKLSFISQEIGREVNTLGAKAQEPNIQQIVVQMKDELEKIKEQVLNIL